MKAVLISIQPKWAEEICHKIGETNEKPIYKKRIEVRKGRPKEKLPIKCFIYETYDKKYDGIGVCWGQGNIFEHACKKVIGEFICDRIDEYACSSVGHGELSTTCGTCLTYDEILNYCNGNDLYGWHISELKIYDKPKELSEFFYACKQPKGTDCSQCIDRREKTCYSITRPPQSWCYVEVTE